MKSGSAGPGPVKAAGAEQAQRSALTPRETEMVDLLAKGFIYKEIADQLNVSAFTVANHLAHVRDKWKVHNIAGIVGCACLRPVEIEAARSGPPGGP